MEKYLIYLSAEAKNRINEVYKKKNRCKIGREYAKFVVTKTVHRKKIKGTKGTLEILEAAMKAATASQEWLELLTVTANEITNAQFQTTTSKS